MIRSLSLRITLVKPPHGVPLCLQQGKDDLVPPSAASGEQVSFDFSVNIANDRTDGPPNFAARPCKVRLPADSSTSTRGLTQDKLNPAGRDARRRHLRQLLGS
jgi:hypothetical protein